MSSSNIHPVSQTQYWSVRIGLCFLLLGSGCSDSTDSLSSSIGVSSEGLVAHLLAEEPCGTTAHDLSGEGNDGLLTNGPSWENGALSLDGGDDYVDLGTLDVQGAALTLAALVNTSSLENCGANDCRIISKASGTATQAHHWMLSTIQIEHVSAFALRLAVQRARSSRRQVL